MSRLSLASCALLISGCVKSTAVQCADGRVCPAETTCTATGCATDDELAACRDAEDGTSCSTAHIADGACRGGACVELSCGDGYKSPAEMCDPAANGADAESTCLGRGFYDENIAVHCAADCTWDTSPCSLYCGDGIVTAPHETCDGAAPTGTCLDYGFDRGTLDCRPGLCVPAFDACDVLGWRIGNSGAITHSDAALLGSALYVAASVLGSPSPLGAVLRYDGAWSKVGDFASVASFLPTPRAVSALADNDIWVAGYHDDTPNIGKGLIAHWNGTTWTANVQLDSSTALDVWAVAPNDVHVLVKSLTSPYDYELRRWTGSSWSSTGTLAGNSRVEQLWGFGPDDVYLVGGNIGIRRFMSGAWSTMTAPFTAAYRIWGTGPGNMLVLAADPNAANALEVFRWDGSQWQGLDFPSTAPIYDNDLRLWATAANDVYVGQSTGDLIIRVYHYDGTSWRLISDRFLPTQPFLLAGTDADHIMALGYGHAYEYSGSSWQQPSTGPATGYAYSLWAASDANAYMADEARNVLHYDGRSWAQVSGVTGYRIGGSAASNVYSYDDAQDLLYRYDGSSWSTPVSPGTLLGENELLVRAQNDVYFVASKQGVSGTNVYRWDGATLTDQQLGIVNGGNCVANGPCLVFTSTTLAVSTSAGSWSSLPAPPFTPISAAWVAGDGIVLASIYNGAMLRFRNGAWEQLANPAGLAFGRMHGTSSSDVYALNSASATLMHFDGTTWTPVRMYPPNGTDLSSMWATPKTIFFGGGDGNGAPIVLHLDRLRP